jgi:hypothetical protein
VADWGFVVIMSIVPRRRRRTVAGLLVLVVISLTAACGVNDNDPAAPDPTPHPTTTTTEPSTTTLSESDQKIEAAKAAWSAYLDAIDVAAADPVTPDLPDVQALMTGDFQIATTASLEDLQAKGQAVRQPQAPRHPSTFMEAELQADGSVHLRSCEVDASILYVVATGDVLNDAVATYVVDVSMVNEAGVWKVASASYGNRQPGATSCAG